MVDPSTLPVIPAAVIASGVYIASGMYITYGVCILVGLMAATYGIKDTVDSKLQRERLNLEGGKPHVIVQTREKLREDEPKSLARLTYK